MKRLGLCFTVSNNGYETLDSLHMEMSCVEDVRTRLSLLQYQTGERHFIVSISHSSKGLVLELIYTRAGGRGLKGDDNDTACIFVPSGVYVDALTLTTMIEILKKELSVSPLRRKSIAESAYVKYFEKEYRDTEMLPTKEEPGKKVGSLEYGPGTGMPSLTDALRKMYNIAMMPYSSVILLNTADNVTVRQGSFVTPVNPSGLRDASEFKLMASRPETPHITESQAPRPSGNIAPVSGPSVIHTTAAKPMDLDTPVTNNAQNKNTARTLLLAAIAFVVGAGLGLGLGFFLFKSGTSEELPEIQNPVTSQTVPDSTEIDKAVETVQEAGEAQEPEKEMEEPETWQDKARHYIEGHEVLNRKEIPADLPQLVDVWDALNTFDGVRLKELNSGIESIKLAEIVRELEQNPQPKGRTLCGENDFKITLAKYIGKINKTPASQTETPAPRKEAGKAPKNKGTNTSPVSGF